MKKDLGVQPYLFPMPTYMIGTYNEDDSVDVMMMAWGGICDMKMVALNLEEDHKTVANLKNRMAFTLAIPGTDTLVESDYLGLVSANKDPEKFKHTGLHAYKSANVDAPVIEEYPLTLECKVVEIQQQPYGLRVLGERLLRRGREDRHGLERRRPDREKEQNVPVSPQGRGLPLPAEASRNHIIILGESVD